MDLKAYLEKAATAVVTVPTVLAPATVLFTSTTSPTIQFSLDCNV